MTILESFRQPPEKKIPAALVAAFLLQTAGALAARQKQMSAGEAAARQHAAAQAANGTQIQTVIREVPVYVTPKAAAACVLPCGFVRLLDAAASGGDPGGVRAAIAPG